MKAHTRLTGARIAAARREAARAGQEKWLSDDDGSRGVWRLVARVSPSGPVRLYVRPPARQDPKKSSRPIGLFWQVSKTGYLTLTEARAKAATVISGLHAPGLTPAAHAQAAKDDRSAASVTVSARIAIAEPIGEPALATLQDVCDVYVAHLKARTPETSSGRDVEQRFRQHVSTTPLWTQPAHQIAPEAFLQLIKDLRREFKANPINRHGQPRGELTIEKVRSYLSSAYQYVINSKKDAQFEGESARFCQVTINPVKEGVKPLDDVHNARERNLSDSELGIVWRRIRNDKRLKATVVRLMMLLGGQRLLQLLRVRLEHVNLEAQTILLFDGKGRRPKNRNRLRPHLLPLTPMVLKEVEELVEISKSLGSKFLFPGASEKEDKHLGANTVSRYVTELSRKLVAESQAGGTSDEMTETFELIDLRRTMETRLSTKLVPKDLRAQLLSHGLSGVQDKHYDKYDYLPQKREILIEIEKMLKGFER